MSFCPICRTAQIWKSKKLKNVGYFLGGKWGPFSLQFWDLKTKFWPGFKDDFRAQLSQSQRGWGKKDEDGHSGTHRWVEALLSRCVNVIRGGNGGKWGENPLLWRYLPRAWSRNSNTAAKWLRKTSRKKRRRRRGVWVKRDRGLVAGVQSGLDWISLTIKMTKQTTPRQSLTITNIPEDWPSDGFVSLPFSWTA